MNGASENRPRRLLFLVNDAPFFVSHRLSLATAALDRGFAVDVAAPHDPDASAAIARAGATFHDLPLRRGGQNPFAEARLCAAFFSLMRTLRPDLVHAITMKPVIYGGAAARLARAPAVVFSVTGLGHLFLTETPRAKTLRRAVLALFRFALHHPNARTIFQNADDRRMFEQAGIVDPDTTVLLPGTGVDLTVFRPRDVRGGHDGEPPVVLFPARLIGEKGVREFAAAARRVKADGVAGRFVLAGRSDPENPSDVGAARVAEWQRDGIVEYWGFSTDMPETLRRADVVCMPSYREGSPRSLIEALATGLPIVTTDAIGCRDLVEDGGNGYLVPVGNSAAVADALRKLLRDPGLRARMGAHSRAMAERTYGVDKFVTDTFAVYQAVYRNIGENGAVG